MELVRFRGRLHVRADFGTQGGLHINASDLVQQKPGHGNEGSGKRTTTAAGAVSAELRRQGGPLKESWWDGRVPEVKGGRAEVTQYRSVHDTSRDHKLRKYGRLGRYDEDFETWEADALAAIHGPGMVGK